MKLVFGLLALLMTIPAASQAREVAIRSGEHETFSRLVISIGEAVGWQLEHHEDEVQITLSDASADFDTGVIFDRIPRTRLSRAIDQGNGVLALTLACRDCHADAFIWQAGKLVIDIIDGPGPNAMSLPDTPEFPVIFSHVTRRMPIFGATFGTGPDIPSANKAIVEEVSRDVARAVSEGFLDPVGGLPASQARSQAMPAPDANANSRELDEPMAAQAEGAAPPQPGIQIGTPFEQDLQTLLQATSSNEIDDCLPPATWAVAEWASEQPFAEQIADLRDSLYGEFDQESSPAILRLARGYIHFGFGQEAMVILAEADFPEAAALRELAALVDGKSSDFSVLSTQLSCSNGAAPWAVLAGLHSSLAQDRGETLRSFRIFPEPLRSQLAAPFARELIAYGDLEGAESILRFVDGTDSAEIAQTTEVIATFEAAAGRPLDAFEILTEHLVEQARASPDAVIHAISIAVEQEITPQPELMSIAAAFRYELRGTEAETRLAASEIAGHVAAGDHQKALQLLNEYGPSLVNSIDLATLVAKGIADHATDSFFLNFAFSDSAPQPNETGKNEIATRLISLGFPDRALQVMSGRASGEDLANRRYLRSEAALLLGQYADALAHIQGIRDERAQHLRARALMGAGDYLGALTTQAGPSDLSLEFRAEAWERLSLTEDPLLTEVARVALNSPTSLDFAGLSDRELALQEAARSRTRASDLLDRFQVPDAD